MLGCCSGPQPGAGPALQTCCPSECVHGGRRRTVSIKRPGQAVWISSGFDLLLTVLLWLRTIRKWSQTPPSDICSNTAEMVGGSADHHDTAAAEGRADRDQDLHPKAEQLQTSGVAKTQATASRKKTPGG